MGGCGIRRAADTCNAAFYAAITSAFLRSDLETGALMGTPTGHAYIAAHEALVAAGIPTSACITYAEAEAGDLLPANPRDARTFYAGMQDKLKLQRLLTRTAEDNVMQAQEATFGNIEMARTAALKGYGPSALLTARPTRGDSFTTISNHDFYVALCTYLGLPFVEHTITKCGTCNRNVHPEHDPLHGTGCTQNRNHAGKVRHDHIAQEVVRIARVAGAVVEREQTPDNQRGRLRPDIIIYHPHGLEFADVCVVNILAASRTRNGHAQPATMLGALDDAARGKHAKYANLVEEHKATFSALAIDVFGRMSDDFVQFMRRLAGIAVQNGVITLSMHASFLREAIERIVLAMHRGQAVGMRDFARNAIYKRHDRVAPQRAA